MAKSTLWMQWGLALAMLVWLLACTGTTATERETPDFNQTDGDASIEDGDTTEQDTTEDEATDGDAVDGVMTDGDVTDGDITDGDVTDGDATDGDVTDGDMTDGDVTNGDVTDGDATDGDVTDGDVTDGDTDITDGDVDYGPPYNDPAWLSQVHCTTPPPEGAHLAADPPTYSGGECPALEDGFNTIVSSGVERRFMLLQPSDIQPDEQLPVLFMWHWLQSKPQSFVDHGEIREAVDQQRFIAVVPESLYDINLFSLLELPWPFVNFISQARIDQEVAFFDDMLACVAQNFTINKECVSTVGVSAGALWSVQLATRRSEHIASLLSLSGGVGVQGLVSNFVLGWTIPTRAMPTIVLWGGPADSCIMLNFQSCSQELERFLIEGGHFFIECIHNCKHGEPPIDPPEGMSRYHTLWDFLFRHPFWLPDGLSPYTDTGLPDTYIDWCGIGAGSATPRVGACDPPSCPI